MICNKILGKVTKLGEKRTKTLGVATRFMVGGAPPPPPLGFIGLNWLCAPIDVIAWTYFVSFPFIMFIGVRDQFRFGRLTSVPRIFSPLLQLPEKQVVFPNITFIIFLPGNGYLKSSREACSPPPPPGTDSYAYVPLSACREREKEREREREREGEREILWIATFYSHLVKS